MDTDNHEGKEPPQEVQQEIKIERPKRAKITEAEAIKWTEEFAAKRKERFIASVRKSKS